MRIDHSMTIYTAADLKPKLLAAIATSETPDVELSMVPEIDTAGLQLLILARREANAIGRTFRILEPSACVTELLSLVDLPLVDPMSQTEGGRAS